MKDSIILVCIACILLIIATDLLVSGDSYDEEMASREHYCIMTRMWKEDEKSGIPANERRGWPPYAKNIYCEDQAHE